MRSTASPAMQAPGFDILPRGPDAKFKMRCLDDRSAESLVGGKNDPYDHVALRSHRSGFSHAGGNAGDNSRAGAGTEENGDSPRPNTRRAHRRVARESGRRHRRGKDYASRA